MHVLRWFALSAFLIPSLAEAKPGFYFGFRGGTATERGDVDDLNDVIFGTQVENELVGPTKGLLTGLHLGYNILGYAAVETGTDMMSRDLLDGSRRVVPGWTLGARVYPLWHWREKLPGPLQDLEPSFLAGVGGGWLVWTSQGEPDPFGFGGALGSRILGGALEYSVLRNLRVGIDYRNRKTNYDKFIFNVDEGDVTDLDPPMVDSLDQWGLTVTMQFPGPLH